MDTPMTDSTPNTGQVQVHFTTSDPDLELPEGKRQLLVPTDVRRYGLSQILNSEAMLGLSSPIPFDILINGHFLRTTLSEYLTSAGLSPETTITLQYVRSLIPPLYAASFEHDDWVSSIDILSTTSTVATWPGGNQLEKGQEKILSGSYDGLLRVWNKSGQTIATSASSSAGGHTMSIKDAKFISPSLIASASMDCTLRLWKYSEAEDHLSAKLSPAQVLYGHKGMVSSLSVHGKAQRILSASGDGNIGLWTTDSKNAPAAREALIPKRRKLSTNTPTAGSLALIKHHTAAVQAAIFHPDDPTVAYSCSLDHTVRTTDLSTQKLVDTRTLSHALISLSALPGITSQLLAAGTTARHITLLDPRVSSQTTQVMTLRGHTNMINSIAPDPTSNYGLVSGSHDGTCRIWDLRSTRSGTREEGGGLVGESVYVIERESKAGSGKKPVGGEGVKVFGVKWDTDLGIVSGGEDKMVQINRSPRT